MHGSKGGMTRRMPVLGEDHRIKLPHDRVNAHDDLVSSCNSKCATGAKIVLDVDNKERVHGAIFLHEYNLGTVLTRTPLAQQPLYGLFGIPCIPLPPSIISPDLTILTR